MFFLWYASRMTVLELIERLQKMDADAVVMHDNVDGVSVGISEVKFVQPSEDWNSPPRPIVVLSTEDDPAGIPTVVDMLQEIAERDSGEPS